MYTEISKQRLSKAHIDLITLATALEGRFPGLQITCSVRGELDQNKAYNSGNSKARFGQSPHNFKQSLALDFVFITDGKPDWTVTKYLEMIKVSKEIAARYKLNLTYGGEFKSLKDYPHIELTNWKTISKTISLAKV